MPRAWPVVTLQALILSASRKAKGLTSSSGGERLAAESTVVEGG